MLECCKVAMFLKTSLPNQLIPNLITLQLFNLTTFQYPPHKFTIRLPVLFRMILINGYLCTMAEQLIELNVTGMHCNNCAMSVHKLLEKKGLHNILVDFAGEEVKFSNDGS